MKDPERGPPTVPEPARFPVTKRSAEHPTPRRAPEGAPPGVPDLGEVIAGRYRIERYVGSGGMAHVLAAEHVELGHHVAIKVIDPSLADDAEVKERFAREARAMASLSSQHTVRVHDVGLLPNGIPFMVMELLEGRDLGQVLNERGSLPFDEACSYIEQACDALDEAHHVGLVHRDLKPQNLFLVSPGIGEDDQGPRSVRVLDFGIARAIGGRLKLETITRAGALVGTLTYMSPEQIRTPKEVGPASDIWALGVCLYRFVAGRLPWSKTQDGELIESILVDPPNPMTTPNGDPVPPVLESIVLRCLRKRPEERFASARGLKGAVAEAREQLALLPFSDPQRRASERTGAVHKHTLRGGASSRISVPEPDRPLPEKLAETKPLGASENTKPSAGILPAAPVATSFPVAPALVRTAPLPQVAPPVSAPPKKQRSSSLLFVLIILIVALLILVVGLTKVL